MAITIELYRLDPQSGSYEIIDIIEDYKGLNWTRKRRSRRSCSFQLDAFEPKVIGNDALKRYRTHVCIKNNNTVEFFGPIIFIRGGSQDVGGFIQVEAGGMLSHFLPAGDTERTTSASDIYNNVDAGQIAWALISYSQGLSGGNLGIAQGTIEVTESRDRTYEYRNIGQEILGLASLSTGFEFEFAPTVDANNRVTGLVFNVFTMVDAIRTDLPTLQAGINVSAWTKETSSDIANAVTGIGAGTGSEILTVTAEDIASQNSFTRRELLYSRKDISVTTTLETDVDSLVTTRNGDNFALDIQLIPNTVPDPATLVFGDILQIDLKMRKRSADGELVEVDSFNNFKGFGTVQELHFEVDETGVVFVTPRLDIIN